MKEIREIDSKQLRAVYKDMRINGFDWEEFYSIIKDWDRFEEISSKLGIRKDANSLEWIQSCHKEHQFFFDHLDGMLEINYLQKKDNKGNYKDLFIL